MQKLMKTSPSLWRHSFQCRCLCSEKVPAKPTEDPNAAALKKLEVKDLPKIQTRFVPKDAKDLAQWRTTWHQNEGQYFFHLKALYSPESHTTFLQWLHTPIDLRPSAFKKRREKNQEEKEIFMQSYIALRNQTLGNELAAAHFLLYRGGAVKFHGNNQWMRRNEFGNYELPRHFNEDYVLEAVDCSHMNLYYEGLVNLRELKRVEWASFRAIRHFDDWWLDRISNIFRHSLVYLDIRDCPNYSWRGLGALYKMERLKILCIDDMRMTSDFEMTCLMLQDENPHLDIRVGPDVGPVEN